MTARTLRRHVWISGRVQGVFFRGSCGAEARRASVRGWVRNLDDGRVEAVFEGPPAAVERLVAWCRRGPPAARVQDVQVQDETPTAEFDGFQIVA